MSRRARRDRGISTLEFVGLLPLALIAIALVLQTVLIVHTVQAANDAARQAARAYSLGRSASDAARATLPDNIAMVGANTFGPHHGARVTVVVPRITTLLPAWRVSREAVMP